MRLKDVVPAFAAALIAAGPQAATAQNDPEGDIDQCRSLSSASRTRADACGNDDTRAEATEQVLRLTLDKSLIEFAQCEASMVLDYVQIGTSASVEGVIENEDCGASGGEYTIQARVRDETGETKTLDFPESWQRDDDQPVSFSAEYPIGTNVELVRIRSRGLRCECAEPLAESEATPAQ